MFVSGACLVSVGFVFVHFWVRARIRIWFVSGFVSGAHLNSSLICLSRGSYLGRI